MIECPNCNGSCGWIEPMGGLWVECDECQGSGYVNDDEDEDE